MLQLPKFLCAVPVLLISLAVSAEAQTVAGQFSRLETQMGANDTTKATAKYEQGPRRRKFDLELENAVPFRMYGVRIVRQGRMIDWGTFRTNEFGFAEVDIDTFKGDQVPAIQPGDIVEIWFSQKRILAGILKNRK